MRAGSTLGHTGRLRGSSHHPCSRREVGRRSARRLPPPYPTRGARPPGPGQRPLLRRATDLAHRHQDPQHDPAPASRHAVRRHARQLMDAIIGSLGAGGPKALTELARLGRTLKRRSASGTSPATSPDRYSRPAASDSDYTLNRDEPDFPKSCVGCAPRRQRCGRLQGLHHLRMFHVKHSAGSHGGDLRRCLGLPIVWHGESVEKSVR